MTILYLTSVSSNKRGAGGSRKLPTILLCLLVCSLLSAMTSSLDVYPWVGKDFLDRSQEILDNLRNNMGLDVIGEDILAAIQSAPNQELIAKNLEGTEFAVRISNPKEKENKKRSELEELRYNPILLSKKLEGLCSVMAVDYWNYEWCHRRMISQFHVEQHENKYVKQPDWSLGKYTRSIVVRAKGDFLNESAPIVKIVDYFVDGQICHETNQKRHTEVHIQCCDGLTLPSPPQSSETFLSNYYTKKNGGGQIGVELVFASLNAITEPGLCAYEATVCTPLLCSPKDAAEVSTTTGTSSKKNDIKNSKTPYKDVMKIINGTCLMKQEDWWTYEVCFSRGVRQMHFNIDQSFAKDGSIIQTKVLASQFHLGLANVSVYEHEDLLANLSSANNAGNAFALSGREAEIFKEAGMLSPLFRTRGHVSKVNHLSLHFSNGTACDLDNLNRSTVVEIYCGPMNLLYQIREESTCQYRIKVELPTVCDLPGFSPRKENVTTIVFEALHPEQFEASSIEATTTTEPSTGSSLKKDESVEITADGEQHFTTTTSTTNEAVVDEILDQLVDAIIEEEETLQSEGGEPSNQLNDFVDQLITELEERSEEGAEVHVDLTNLRDEDGNSLIEEEGVYDEDDEEYDDDKQDGDNSTGEEEVIGNNGQHLG